MSSSSATLSQSSSGPYVGVLYSSSGATLAASFGGALLWFSQRLIHTDRRYGLSRYAVMSVVVFGFCGAGVVAGEASSELDDESSAEGIGTGNGCCLNWWLCMSNRTDSDAGTSCSSWPKG